MHLMHLEQREREKSPDGFPHAFSPPFLSLFDLVSLLIHTRSEKFEAVDTAWTRDRVRVIFLQRASPPNGRNGIGPLQLGQ